MWTLLLVGLLCASAQLDFDSLGEEKPAMDFSTFDWDNMWYGLTIGEVPDFLRCHSSDGCNSPRCHDKRDLPAHVKACIAVDYYSCREKTNGGLRGSEWELRDPASNRKLCNRPEWDLSNPVETCPIGPYFCSDDLPVGFVYNWSNIGWGNNGEQQMLDAVRYPDCSRDGRGIDYPSCARKDPQGKEIDDQTKACMAVAFYAERRKRGNGMRFFLHPESGRALCNPDTYDPILKTGCPTGPRCCSSEELAEPPKDAYVAKAPGPSREAEEKGLMRYADLHEITSPTYDWDSYRATMESGRRDSGMGSFNCGSMSICRHSNCLSSLTSNKRKACQLVSWYDCDGRIGLWHRSKSNPREEPKRMCLPDSWYTHGECEQGPHLCTPEEMEAGGLFEETLHWKDYNFAKGIWGSVPCGDNIGCPKHPRCLERSTTWGGDSAWSDTPNQVKACMLTDFMDCTSNGLWVRHHYREARVCNPAGYDPRRANETCPRGPHICDEDLSFSEIAKYPHPPCEQSYEAPLPAPVVPQPAEDYNPEAPVDSSDYRGPDVSIASDSYRGGSVPRTDSRYRGPDIPESDPRYVPVSSPLYRGPLVEEADSRYRGPLAPIDSPKYHGPNLPVADPRYRPPAGLKDPEAAIQYVAKRQRENPNPRVSPVMVAPSSSGGAVAYCNPNSPISPPTDAAYQNTNCRYAGSIDCPEQLSTAFSSYSEDARLRLKERMDLAARGEPGTACCVANGSVYCAV